MERALNAEEIGRRLRELRGVHRTLADVSDGSGISPQQVSQYENGQRIPSAETVAKLAAYYDTSIDYIFLGQN
ncbi:MAG: helix-turn-helix transcriptional regulator [Mogibacterium sp.]|jgi:transcriptional regulator with XRE-family HTH domain|nr:helix-turn-helix transcriptional regulator [Mogibacterium sp.]MBR4090390.1 helix-turn-helix transcriptional regulator [Mogibacterium sp.]